MPVSSIGALNAWGVYLVASAALVGVLVPQLSGTARDSREGADYRVADGIRSVLNMLSPGTSVTLSFGNWPESDTARLAGHSVIFEYGNGTVALLDRWALPNLTLSPGAEYRVSLEGSTVAVSTVG